MYRLGDHVPCICVVWGQDKTRRMRCRDVRDTGSVGQWCENSEVVSVAVLSEGLAYMPCCISVEFEWIGERKNRTDFSGEKNRKDP